jgi:chromosome segregation ATPase
MSDIVEELLESFRASAQRLEELSDGLEELQNAQKLVENLSSNLGEAAQALQGTSTSHDNFIKSARTTNEQLGEVINVLKGLDTKSINSTLSKIVNGLNENKGKLTDLASSLTDAENKATAAGSKLDQISKQLEAVVAANSSLSTQLADAHAAIIRRADEAGAAASGRHKTTMFLVLIVAAASGVLIANLFG